MRGKGVLLATIAGDDPRELARPDVVRALEHEMFEQVGDAGLPERLVRGADLVPEHVAHHRHAMI